MLFGLCSVGNNGWLYTNVDFKRGRTDTNDAEPSVIPENTKKLVLDNRKLKLSWRYQSMRKWCSKWVQGLLTLDPKQQRVDNSDNSDASTIQSDVCNCFNETKRVFYVNMSQCRKHGSATSLRSQIGRQLSGQRQMKAVQSDQRRKHQQARFWPPYFGMRKVFCSPISLRKEEPSIANII